MRRKYSRKNYIKEEKQIQIQQPQQQLDQAVNTGLSTQTKLILGIVIPILIIGIILGTLAGLNVFGNNSSENIKTFTPSPIITVKPPTIQPTAPPTVPPPNLLETGVYLFIPPGISSVMASNWNSYARPTYIADTCTQTVDNIIRPQNILRTNTTVRPYMVWNGINSSNSLDGQFVGPTRPTDYPVYTIEDVNNVSSTLMKQKDTWSSFLSTGISDGIKDIVTAMGYKSEYNYWLPCQYQAPAIATGMQNDGNLPIVKPDSGGINYSCNGDTIWSNYNFFTTTPYTQATILYGAADGGSQRCGAIPPYQVFANNSKWSDLTCDYTQTYSGVDLVGIKFACMFFTYD